MKVACGADDVVNNTALAKIASKDATADWSDFDNTNESLEALRDGVLTTIAADVVNVDGIVPAAAEDLTTAQSDLDKITGVNGVLIDDDAIKATKFDESTAFPVKAADTGATQIARVGADSDTLETLSDQLDAVATLGAGATAVTYTVLDGDSNPIDGVAVWVTTHVDGSNVVASGSTNDSGKVTFMLDSGTTYYIWSQKAGYNFTNPDTEVVP